jgi:hypothetical protein
MVHHKIKLTHIHTSPKLFFNKEIAWFEFEVVYYAINYGLEYKSNLIYLITLQ